MTSIVKRKLRETWRAAVGRRLDEADPALRKPGLAAFDQAVAAGQGEAEAAWAVLSEHGLLWHVDAPGFSAAAPQPAAAENPHEVPRV